ncbi:MAG: Na+-transporting NADH:ubiquinone oxidoreductase subunit A [Myxococcota bacterium]
MKKGLDLPIAGKPDQTVSDGATVTQVALLAADFATMKARIQVDVGDIVKRGQALFADRKANGIVFTAPGAGEVIAVNRGERRALQSVVIALSASEIAGAPTDDEFQTFAHYKGNRTDELDRAGARALLSESGLWTSFRARPFNRIPSFDEDCQAIFVNAMDTNPLAPNMDLVMAGRERDVSTGIEVLKTLTDGAVFFCKAAGSALQGGSAQVEEFRGKHPAGLTGTHIHTLHPVNRTHVVWSIDVQDVAAIGALIRTGRLDVTRTVSLGGPAATTPRLLKTRMGASLRELTAGELAEGEVRVVRGSILSGHTAAGDIFGFLGRYDHGIACLAEDRERHFLGWMAPGGKMYSTVRAFLSGFLPKKEYALTTTTHGSPRAMVPIGMFERVMPLDIMPTFLLRALMVDDLERAEKLGCLELAEEDLGLCSFVSPGKEDYGKHLRRNLTTIWNEG